MKKTLSVLLILVVLLSFVYTPAFAAQGTMTLLETRNDAGGGVIFVFQFSSDFTKSDFKGGFVFFGDMKLPMNCNIADAAEGILQCTTSRAAAGQHVTINLAGFVFYTFVPLRTGGGSATQYCYNIFDTFPEFDNQQYLGTYWEAFDAHCQDDPAAYGEVLYNVYNPFYDYYYDYQFGPSSPPFVCANNSVVEDAYYWDGNCET